MAIPSEVMTAEGQSTTARQFIGRIVVGVHGLGNGVAILQRSADGSAPWYDLRVITDVGEFEYDVPGESAQDYYRLYLAKKVGSKDVVFRLGNRGAGDAVRGQLVYMEGGSSGGGGTGADIDILGVTTFGRRTNQVELAFDTSFDSAVITNTATGGASATISNGHALYSSSTSSTTSVTGISVSTVNYRPAHEQYVYFTAAFTTPTDENGVQRIGLFDGTDGFFIGYEGSVFGSTVRSGGVDTTTSLAASNGDVLSGGSGSKFSRAGVAEAIDVTKSNLYRIRWAWLGSGPVSFEVFSPDAEWVVFHTLRYPNLQLNPSIENPDLPVKIEVAKTGGDATNLILYTACIAGGTTTDLESLTTTLTDSTLASLNRSVIAGRSSAGGGTYYNVKVTPSGSLLTAIGDIGDVAGEDTMANSLPVVLATSTGQAPTSASVGTSSGSLGIAAGNYVKMSFCNTSGNTICIAFDNTAALNSGIVLATQEKLIIDGPITVASAVNAIASGAASNLAIQVFT